jgi:hypothetical protein
MKIPHDWRRDNITKGHRPQKIMLSGAFTNRYIETARTQVCAIILNEAVVVLRAEVQTYRVESLWRGVAVWGRRSPLGMTNKKQEAGPSLRSG